MRGWLYRSQKLVGALALLTTTTLTPAVALAQPAVHGYVEPCTVAIVQDGNTDCEACTPTHADPDHCQTELGARGYQKKCQTGGHSAPGEVWCKPRDAEADHSRVAVFGAMLGGIAAFVAAFIWLKRRNGSG